VATLARQAIWQALRDTVRENIRVALNPPSALVWLSVGAFALVASNDLPNYFALPRVTDPLVATLTFAALLLAFAAFALGVWAISYQRRGGSSLLIPASAGGQWVRIARWLWYPLLLWLVLVSAQSLWGMARTLAKSTTHWPPSYTSDDLYDNQYNALLTLRGQNPYVGDHLIASLDYFHINGYTPLERGQFSNPFAPPTATRIHAILAAYRAHPNAPHPEVSPLTIHSYPAGAFLVYTPFVWAGLPSMTPAQFTLWLALVLGIMAIAPPSWRLTVTLLALCNFAALERILTGDFDIWWIAPLVLAWALASSRFRSAALIGLACAIKQTAWFLAPFYLIWAWRAFGPREALRRAAIALAAFLLINLPWILVSPRDWLTSVFVPISLPMFPGGVGLIGLTLAHLLPLYPRLVYTILEGGVMLGLLAVYWRVATRAPTLGLFIGLAPLVMAWRADERYFLLLSLLAVAAVILAAVSSDALKAKFPQSGLVNAYGLR
jgi:hypothetical protein